MHASVYILWRHHALGNEKVGALSLGHVSRSRVQFVARALSLGVKLDSDYSESLGLLVCTNSLVSFVETCSLCFTHFVKRCEKLRVLSPW